MTEDTLEIAISKPNAAMGDVLPEQPRIQRAVNEVPIPKGESIVSQDSCLQSRRRIFWRLLPLLDKSPIRLPPYRIHQLGFDAKLAARSLENPIPTIDRIA